MLPSTEARGDKMTTQLAEKRVSSIAQIVEEYMNEMMATEDIYVMVVWYLRVEMTKEEEKS